MGPEPRGAGLNVAGPAPDGQPLYTSGLAVFVTFRLFKLRATIHQRMETSYPMIRLGPKVKKPTMSVRMIITKLATALAKDPAHQRGAKRKPNTVKSPYAALASLRLPKETICISAVATAMTI